MKETTNCIVNWFNMELFNHGNDLINIQLKSGVPIHILKLIKAGAPFDAKYLVLLMNYFKSYPTF